MIFRIVLYLDKIRSQDLKHRINHFFCFFCFFSYFFYEKNWSKNEYFPLKSCSMKSSEYRMPLAVCASLGMAQTKKKYRRTNFERIIIKSIEMDLN